MTEKELQELYLQEFPAEMTWDEASNKLNMMQSHPYFQELCRMFCDILITILTENYVKYDFDVTKTKIYQIFLYNIKKLKKDDSYYWSLYYFFKKNYNKCKENIHDLFVKWKHLEYVLYEEDIVLYFVLPFKNAFDGFWAFINDELKQVQTENNINELCKLVDKYYSSYPSEQALEYLQSFIQKYPTYELPIEWLGYTYYTMSMWNNAIAYFEKVNKPFFFGEDKIYWMLAWSYGKIKDYMNEEKYYRKCQQIEPETEYLLNNLGYSLYKQKKYSEAKSTFEECLSKNIDLPYSANNYVRVLITIGRNNDAKRFIKKGKYHVSKSLKDKVSKLDNSNARLKKDALATVEIEEENSIEQSSLVRGIKCQQFSNEKLLEDELTAKIESGIPIFGLNLKIYKRYGEYGRQYIIPIGRLDLLCEDTEGNLYVIELKKDSGYGDVYKQLSNYLTWFEQSDKFKGKKIYGIICLNNPSRELIEKVHADKRMRLYEYQISYVQR